VAPTEELPWAESDDPTDPNWGRLPGPSWPRESHHRYGLEQYRLEEQVQLLNWGEWDPKGYQDPSKLFVVPSSSGDAFGHVWRAVVSVPR
jgi:hypothetical protein